MAESGVPQPEIPADVLVLVKEANPENLVHIYDSIQDAEKRKMFLHGLSSELKAAILGVMKVRLAQKGAQNQQPQKQQYPAPKLGYAYVRGGNNYDEPDEMSYFDDMTGGLDDDMDDDYDNDLEEFESEVNQQFAGSAATPSSEAGRDAASSGFAGATVEQLANEFSTQIPAADSTINPLRLRKEIGDFELLRLAKMGDKESFCEYEAMTATDVRLFQDNNKRDALHYAVDGGNLALVKYLVEEKKMTLRKDEKMKANALEMSVLLGRSAIARYLSDHFPPNDVPSFDAVLKEFAAPPPRFCLAKAAPIVSAEERSRVFWSTCSSEPAEQVNDVAFKPEVLDGASSVVASAFSVFLNRPVAVEHHNFDTWTTPVSDVQVSELLPKCSLVGGVSAFSAAGDAHPAAIGALLPIAEALVIASEVLKPVIKSLSSQHPAHLAGWLNVAPQYQHTGRAALLLRYMLQQIPASLVTIFRSSIRLPPQPLCLVKWFRRSVNTMRVFEHLLAASEVYPEFFSYDDRLRVDCVAKETLPEASSSATLPSWQAVTPDNQDRVAEMIQVSLSSLLQQNKAEVFLMPGSAKNSKSHIATTFFAGDVKTFFIESSEGTLKDIIVLRIRESREKTSDAANAPSALTCCTVIFSLFSAVDFPTGDSRLRELLLIAQRLGASTIFAPSTCGFTDSDFSKANFSEVETYREYLYAVSTNGEKNEMPRSVVGASAPNSSKIFLPFALM